jgi:hypothetical protein
MKIPPKIKNRRYIQEPMNCQRKGCKEDLNGLRRYTIDFGKGFVFELWLCEDCSEQFNKLAGEKK